MSSTKAKKPKIISTGLGYDKDHAEIKVNQTSVERRSGLKRILNSLDADAENEIARRSLDGQLEGRDASRRQDHLSDGKVLVQ